MRAATAIRVAADGGGRALAWRRLARVPSWRKRLQAIAVTASQAALAVNSPIAGGPRAVAQVGDDLLDDRVASVLLLGLDQLERESVKTAW